MTDKQLSVISLFTGVGGLDYGFEAAGFETKVAVERDPYCCDSLRESRNWSVIQNDLLEVETREILEQGGLGVGMTDMLIGGPPCQPFSKSGWWKSGDSLRLDDPRASTLGGYLRVLEEAKPRAFLLENVEGLAFGGKDEGLKLLLKAIDRINEKVSTNYKPIVITLNAADYGVPQTRTRVFIIGEREGKPFIPPTPTHKDPEVFPNSEQRWITAWDALADIPESESEKLSLTGKWADLLPSIPEGLNYLWHTDRMGGEPLFGWRRRYWNFLLKLAKNRPSWTIQAQPGPATGPFHWNNRRLSSEELARLQTFPKDVCITGTRTEVQRQIGNAVPSLLAEVLAREIRAQFFESALKSQLLLKIEPRRDCPPAEPTKKVPRKYLNLTGDHSAHPGTGKGYLYQAEIAQD